MLEVSCSIACTTSFNTGARTEGALDSFTWTSKELLINRTLSVAFGAFYGTFFVARFTLGHFKYLGMN